MASGPIDTRLVQLLISDQFPEWADLPIKPVPVSGHDNRTFRLGDKMSVRLPRARAYSAHVQTEKVWLPKLAPHLPLSIPLPLAMGKPAHGYSWPWSVNRWLDGENADIGRIADMCEFAQALANFLNVLRGIDASEAPLPDRDNFFRGGDLAVYDAETRQCIDTLQDTIDPVTATAIWETALESTWSDAAVWLHGDVAPGNLLVSGGKLSAVIDFGQLAAGDPACDTTIAWTFFSGASRKAFRTALSVDVDTWSRGRGWGIWKALLELRRHRRAGSGQVARARRVLDDILAEQKFRPLQTDGGVVLDNDSHR